MKKAIAISVFVGVMFFSACSNDKPMEEQTEQYTERVRPSGTGGTSAAYFSYTNSLQTADTLLSVTAAFAGMAQVHESYETEDGMMGMREQKNIKVQPGEQLRFKQGGLHIMLMNIKEGLAVGDSVEIHLKFSQVGQISKRLPVAQ
jgi:copper(I)-binding protein